MKLLEGQQQSMREQEKQHQECIESLERRLADEKMQAKILQLEQQVEINKLKSEVKAPRRQRTKVATTRSSS